MTIRVCFVRDHSASMFPLKASAMKDYNSQLESFRGSGAYVSVVECGVGSGARVDVAVRDQKVDFTDLLYGYQTDGDGTPLWDSVGMAINILNFSKGDDPKLVMIITDGYENRSKIWTAEKLRLEIQRLQVTDLWTFVFRVPVGHRKELVRRLGVPEGNVMEWDQNEASFHQSTEQTVQATRSYIQAVASGVTSTNKFYTDLSNVKPSEIKAVADDITTQVRVESVWSDDDGSQIRDFCQKHFGEFEVGRAYYQLTKTEKVQEKKKLIIKHKKKGRYYGGQGVRDLLGLPSFGEVKVVPGNHGEYEIYVQSTSVNRKLLTKTKVLYI